MNKKFKLKESICILKEAEDVYNVVFTATRRIKKFNVDNLVKDVIEQFKIESEVDKIITSLKDKYDQENISRCIHTLENAGIISSYDERTGDSRYQRQISFLDELTNTSEETFELQNRLEAATVAVFGVGGVGTWIVYGLYQIGIGKIKIIDHDIVDETNLNRQLYFTSEDIERYKVDVIQEKLGDTKIDTYKKFVSEDEDLEDIVSECDFLVNCADNPSIAETTAIIAKYANIHNIPYSVSGGYNMHLGMVGPIIVPGKTACFNCFLDYQKRNDPLEGMEKIKDVEQTGSLGPIAGAVANMHVMEIFKFLIGKGDVNFNKFLEIDFMTSNFEWRGYSKVPGCKTCY